MQESKICSEPPGETTSTTIRRAATACTGTRPFRPVTSSMSVSTTVTSMCSSSRAEGPAGPAQARSGVVVQARRAVSANTSYAVMVGAGGATPASGAGNDGSNSSFDSDLVAYGGGGGDELNTNAA